MALFASGMERQRQRDGEGGIDRQIQADKETVRQRTNRKRQTKIKQTERLRDKRNRGKEIKRQRTRN